MLGLNLWQCIKLAGLFILIVIMALSDVSRSKLDRKSVLFFLIIEKTRSSAALLCGIVRTDKCNFTKIWQFISKVSPNHIHTIMSMLH